MTGAAANESADGYRRTPSGGPRLRSDIVDVYVFRQRSGSGTGAGGGAGDVEFLQLLRSGPPLDRTWHPIMGHIEPGESAVRTALRELHEEVGLAAHAPVWRGMWALEQVHPYYIAAIDCIVMSPRFAVEVMVEWTPRLNGEHSSHRWTSADADFMWPGQKRAVEEIRREIIGGGPAREALRVAIE